MPPSSNGNGGNGDVRVVVVDGSGLRRDWRAKLSRPIVGWALAALGAVFIIIGYFGVANEALVAKQIPYLVSGGIGGMVLVAVGAFLLGTDDVRKQLQRVEQLESLVEDLHRTLLVPAGSSETGSVGAASEVTANGAVAGDHHDLVALPRGKSYHKAGCSMVAGKTAPPVDAAELRSRGLRPCPLCSPAPAFTS
jgi:hypothetical protein